MDDNRGIIDDNKGQRETTFSFTAVVYCCLSCRHLNIDDNKGQRRTTIQEENVVLCCLSCRQFSTHPQATCSIHVCAQKSPGLFFTTRRVEKNSPGLFRTSSPLVARPPRPASRPPRWQRATPIQHSRESPLYTGSPGSYRWRQPIGRHRSQKSPSPMGAPVI